MSASFHFELEDTRETDCGSTRSGFGSSLHDSHNRYMSLYSPKCDDEVLRLGNEVPNFDAKTTHGPMNFHKWKRGRWAILFSHPTGFTPVCTSELASLASRHSELKGMDVKVAALSVGPVESHKEWIADVVAQHEGDIKIDYPIISDTDRYISTCYGMLDQWADPFSPEPMKQALTIRSVFFINPENKLMLIMTYPACVGRNMDEIIRCMKALQLSYNRAIATPADWPHNHAVVKLPDGNITADYKGAVYLLPSVTKEEAEEFYPGYHSCEVPSKKDYLRLVKAEDVGTVPRQVAKEDKGRSKERKRRRKPLKAIVRLWYWKVAGKLRSSPSSKSVAQ